MPSAAIAWVARAVYHENYIARPMRHDITAPGASSVGRVAYKWRNRDGWSSLAVAIRGAPTLPAEASEATFITEHYWGYARQPNGSSLEYQVEHPRWRVWQGTDATFECDTASLYGPAFAECLAGKPSSVFVAEGSAIVVHRGATIRAGSI